MGIFGSIIDLFSNNEDKMPWVDFGAHKNAFAGYTDKAKKDTEQAFRDAESGAFAHYRNLLDESRRRADRQASDAAQRQITQLGSAGVLGNSGAYMDYLKTQLRDMSGEANLGANYLAGKEGRIFGKNNALLGLDKALLESNLQFDQANLQQALTKPKEETFWDKLGQGLDLATSLGGGLIFPGLGSFGSIKG